jgi:hypothetical protein
MMYETHALNKRDERTWWISDNDGRNKRRVTLAQYLDEVERASAQCAPIAAAFRRGPLIAAEACAEGDSRALTRRDTERLM